MNNVVNKKNYIQFARTIEEVVSVQTFFDSLQQDFEEIKKLGKYYLKREQETLNFSWPDDTIFNEWVAKYSLASIILHVESKNIFMNK